MKQMIQVILFCLLAVAGYGQSQGEMNETASKAYQKADKELNAVYKRILAEYGQDTTFIKTLSWRNGCGYNCGMLK
jgi:hypothetical protein